MRYIFLIIVYILSACATLPQDFKDEDLVWEEKTVPIKYTQAYKNFLIGERTCSRNEEAPECIPDFESKEINCTVFIASYFGSPMWVIGFVNMKAMGENQTLVRAGVNKKYEDTLFGVKGGIRRLWLRYPEGNFNCNGD
jgi:hypothetical protein